jgi:hypothetical protein
MVVYSVCEAYRLESALLLGNQVTEVEQIHLLF